MTPFISILKYEKIMLLEIKIVICMELEVTGRRHKNWGDRMIYILNGMQTT